MQMKKKVLSAAIFAAMGMGSAHAVNMSQDGTGEVLIFPYYTTQGSEETLISIVNTTAETKAIKVRFLEAMNSAEVLDFNLYMSPYDVWVAKIGDNAAGDGANVSTNDNSCTVPSIVSRANGVDFRSTAYQLDGGPTELERTREGYVEIIEMGIYDELAVFGVDFMWGPNADHGTAGVPANCADLIEAWTATGEWTADASDGILAPTGGLMGSAGIINVALGNEVGTPVTALASFSDVHLHTAPGTLTPNLSQAAPKESVVMVNAGGVDQKAQVYYDAWTTGFAADPVSAVLMADSFMNEFSVNPVVSAETDWVATFPTKRQYTNTGFEPAIRPFTKDFPFAIDGMACEPVTIAVWDREEQTTIPDLDFSPLPDQLVSSLCWEANVINFGDSDVLSSTYVDVSVSSDFNSGWSKISFDGNAALLVDQMMAADSGNEYWGLPVIGFRTTRLANADVVGGNYEMSAPHAYTRMITGPGAAGPGVVSFDEDTAAPAASATP